MLKMLWLLQILINMFTMSVERDILAAITEGNERFLIRSEKECSEFLFMNNEKITDCLWWLTRMKPTYLYTRLYQLILTDFQLIGKEYKWPPQATHQKRRTSAKAHRVWENLAMANRTDRTQDVMQHMRGEVQHLNSYYKVLELRRQKEGVVGDDDEAARAAEEATPTRAMLSSPAWLHRDIWTFLSR